MASNIKSLKIVVLGETFVGKTCMLLSYTTKEFPNIYEPIVNANYASNVTVDGQEYKITLWDTLGQADLDRLRALLYPNTDCFLLCYSVKDRWSYENIKTKWLPEIRHHHQHTPIVLVAMKIDLRDDPTEGTIITTAEGTELTDEIKAAKYAECSAKTGEGLVMIFEAAVKCAIKKRATKCPIKCNML